MLINLIRMLLASHRPLQYGVKIIIYSSSHYNLPNRRAMPDPVSSEAPPIIEATLTVLFCIRSYNTKVMKM